MTRYMTHSNLVRELRRGRTPKDLGGRVIGRGAERTAYRIGPWVVKARTNRIFSAVYRVRAKRIAAYYGAPPVKTTYVKGWMVQPYVPSSNCSRATKTHVLTVERKTSVDFHRKNCGCDTKGRLFSFDW